MGEDVVFGFTEVLGRGSWWEVGAFLHPDIVIRRSPSRVFTGRLEALAHFRAHWDSAGVIEMDVLDVRAAGHALTATHQPRAVGARGAETFSLVATYRVVDDLIVEWTRAGLDHERWRRTTARRDSGRPPRLAGPRA